MNVTTAKAAATSPGVPTRYVAHAHGERSLRLQPKCSKTCWDLRAVPTTSHAQQHRLWRMEGSVWRAVAWEALKKSTAFWRSSFSSSRLRTSKLAQRPTRRKSRVRAFRGAEVAGNCRTSRNKRYWHTLTTGGLVKPTTSHQRATAPPSRRCGTSEPPLRNKNFTGSRHTDWMINDYAMSSLRGSLTTWYRLPNASKSRQDVCLTRRRSSACATGKGFSSKPKQPTVSASHFAAGESFVHLPLHTFGGIVVNGSSTITFVAACLVVSSGSAKGAETRELGAR